MSNPTFIQDHKSIIETQINNLKKVSKDNPVFPTEYWACKLPSIDGTPINSTKVTEISFWGVDHESRSPKKSNDLIFIEAGMLYLPASHCKKKTGQLKIVHTGVVASFAVKDLKALGPKMNRWYLYSKTTQAVPQGYQKAIIEKVLDSAIEDPSMPILGTNPCDKKGQPVCKVGKTSLGDRTTHYVVFQDRPKATEQMFVLFNLYELEKQKEALRTWESSEAQHHMPLQQLLRGKNNWDQQLQSSTRVVENDINWKILIDKDRAGLDEQRDFVHKALNTPDIAVLEGPPGSGKSTVILELILQLVQQGKRILFSSATHVALDSVLERLLEKQTDYNCSLGVLAVRIASNPTTVQQNVWRKYGTENLLKDFITTTKDHLESVSERTRGQEVLHGLAKQTEESEFKTEFQHFLLNQANLVVGTLVGILQHPGLRNPQPDFELFDYLIVDEASKVTMQGFLVPAKYAKRWVLVGDTKQLAPYANNAELEMALVSKLDIKPEVAKAFAKPLSEAYEYRMDPARMEKCEHQLDETLEHYDLIDKAKVLKKIGRVMLPSVLELFQEGLPQMLYPENTSFGLLYGFEGSNIDTTSRFESLRYQHRMVDGLAQISREHFYNDENMRTPASCSINTHLGLLGTEDQSAAVWINQQDGDGGMNCPYEREAVKQTLLKLDAYAKELAQGSQPMITVYVITFYREQLNEMKEMLKEMKLTTIKPVVKTVDSVQGQEADVVLLCFTKYTKDSFYHVPNRLNVALTRAKSRLFLFGPRTMIRKSLSEALKDLANKPHMSLGSTTSVNQ